MLPKVFPREEEEEEEEGKDHLRGFSVFFFFFFKSTSYLKYYNFNNVFPVAYLLSEQSVQLIKNTFSS